MSLLTLYQVHAASQIICQPGQRLTRSKTSCEPCPPNQYNPKSSSSTECRNCEPCGLYSYQVMSCTPKNNTKCHCYDGFIPYDKTGRRCQCQIGSGIKMSGKGKPVCEKCPPKTATSEINSQCQPQHTQKIPGNATSEVNCGNEQKTVVPPSSSLAFSQTSSSTSTTAATTTSVLTTSTNSITELHHSRKHALWLAFLAAFLLLILILKLSRCPKKKTDIVRQGSECGKPVEESGEKFIPAI
ncbi:hypothetical protein KOW79_010052 [Hemibagrus wyckioides]|uniref:TNFR-Cys domain-containing protein n=2 Tax=Hemibagrus wyckioides TaxID=337641 RepID=A0A9D3NNA8_9TELE|nr:hypothetical protein KOW79_010052 [Hemibagrus wyckioides]